MRDQGCGGEHTHRAIPPVGVGLSLALQHLRVGRLQIFASRRLDLDDAVLAMTRLEAADRRRIVLTVGGTKTGVWLVLRGVHCSAK
jgi:hypothetical protein